MAQAGLDSVGSDRTRLLHRARAVELRVKPAVALTFEPRGPCLVAVATRAGVVAVATRAGVLTAAVGLHCHSATWHAAPGAAPRAAAVASASP